MQSSVIVLNPNTIRSSIFHQVQRNRVKTVIGDSYTRKEVRDFRTFSMLTDNSKFSNGVCEELYYIKEIRAALVFFHLCTY